MEGGKGCYLHIATSLTPLDFFRVHNYNFYCVRAAKPARGGKRKRGFHSLSQKKQLQVPV